MMAPELTILIYAALLAFVQFALYAVPGVLQMGIGYAAGPRDEERLPTGIAGRLRRAYYNHLETVPLFAIAVIVLVITGKTSSTTVLTAQIYLAARILYVPAYASGLPWLRSLIWTVATGAIVFLLVLAVA
ncbi:MAG: MAPEG family protein [Pseudomonadota bacterium]